MPGLATAAAALNANDQGLARIAAVHYPTKLRATPWRSKTASSNMRAKKAAARPIGIQRCIHEPECRPIPAGSAPIGGSANESFPVRTAQTDNPTRRSDAAASVGLDRVVLPPGEPNDELEHFLELIANAEPKDEPRLRADIKRHYYEVGDIAGGDALNSALSNILAPGVQQKDRQKILAEIGPYSESEEDDRTVEFWMGLGLLGLGMLAPEIEFAAASEEKTSAAAWIRPPWPRRKIF